ncbi:hypothetical protein LCGC14_2860410 [marine sediment metagenome]|uniref:Uncharacterized protein n=1 Tax=marine sediment metagenome TaxID=412755 RepID=A0A0F8YSI0_9ZZZZ
MDTKVYVIDDKTVLRNGTLYTSDGRYLYSINENEIRLLGKLGEIIEVNE